MKAYRVTGYDVNSNEEKITIVFAEKPSKAKTLASKEPDFHYISYLDLRVKREPLMDKYCQEEKEYIDYNVQTCKPIFVEKSKWQCPYGREFDVQECYDCKSNDTRDKYQEEILKYMVEGDEGDRFD